QDARDVARLGRFGRPFGEPAERADLVDLLECRMPTVRALDLTDQGEHRRRVLARGVDPDRQVGRSDGPRAETRSRAPGEVAVRFGHEGGATLVARCDHADTGVTKTVEEAEERLTRHRERVAHASGPQRLAHQPSDRLRPGMLRLLVPTGLGDAFWRDIDVVDRSVDDLRRPVELDRAPIVWRVGVGDRRGLDRRGWL